MAIKKQTKTSKTIIQEDKIRLRVQIENVQPKISGGRFPVKRIIGDRIRVEADIFADGHNELSAVLLYRKNAQAKWVETPMEHSVNDRWSGEFTVNEIGRWEYVLRAWVNHFKSWQRDFKKRIAVPGNNVDIDLLIGINIIEKALTTAKAKDKEKLSKYIQLLSGNDKGAANNAAIAEELAQIMTNYYDDKEATTYKSLAITVDSIIARFSSWYELFPRSCGAVTGKHGTFKDVIARLPYITEMGFNVLYMPPIHPIGDQFRKGKNNTITPSKSDVGSPWAIGNTDGGHKSIHAQLGTLEDFKELVKQAEKRGIKIALDIAYQCSPDHPYVKEHPEWFRKRPDNTIQYAENPPKKYQDIYPLNFETENWSALWDELKSVIDFWIVQGVRIFRVDNPHTKDLSFWEWLIAGIKKDNPDVIFLAEAFTRPKLMYRLAKLGFSQSYTYFTWRNLKWELSQYCNELNKTEVKEFFRPNFWPNTPDILHEYLQTGGAPAFKVRLILAATLSSNYGIYGPAFELCENKPAAPKSEEYLNSEKYEIKQWDLNSESSIRPLISKINKIRNTNQVLQHNDNLEFFTTDNESLICYGRYNDNYSEILVCVVNLDTYWVQAGFIELPLEKLGLSETDTYEVIDLMDGKQYLWKGRRNFIKLDPSVTTAHIFRITNRNIK